MTTQNSKEKIGGQLEKDADELIACPWWAMRRLAPIALDLRALLIWAGAE